MADVVLPKAPIMDNFYLKVVSGGYDHLAHALELAFSYEQHLAYSWRIDTENGFQLFRSGPNGSPVGTEFPIPHNYQMATDVVWAWLKELSKNRDSWVQYAGEEDDFDGSAYMNAFCVEADGLLMSGDNVYLIAKVKPAWQEAHK